MWKKWLERKKFIQSFEQAQWIQLFRKVQKLLLRKIINTISLINY